MAPDHILTIPVSAEEREGLGRRLHQLLSFHDALVPAMAELRASVACAGADQAFVQVVTDMESACSQAAEELKWCCELIGRARTLTKAERAH